MILVEGNSNELNVMNAKGHCNGVKSKHIETASLDETDLTKT